jgi:hypothetical protein
MVDVYEVDVYLNLTQNLGKLHKFPILLSARNILPLSAVRKPHKMLKRRVHIIKYYLAASANNTLSRIIQLEK